MSKQRYILADNLMGAPSQNIVNYALSAGIMGYLTGGLLDIAGAVGRWTATGFQREKEGQLAKKVSIHE